MLWNNYWWFRFHEKFYENGGCLMICKNVLTLIDLTRSSSLGSRLTKQRFFKMIQINVFDASFLQQVGGTHKIFFEISSVKRSFVGKKKTSGLAAMVSQDVSNFDPYSWSLAPAFLVDTVIRKINRWKVKDWPCEVSIFQEPLYLFPVFSLSSLLMCSHDAWARA